MAILFYSKVDKFDLKRKSLVKSWLKSIIYSYNFKIGDISFVFVSDAEILQVNNQYLSHNYYTDIITFSYNSGNTISGDIFISIDTVFINAKKFNVEFIEELHRVIVHGILHLVGFNDSTESEKLKMKEMEDRYLLLLKSF